jgi:hypothetical protein
MEVNFRERSLIESFTLSTRRRTMNENGKPPPPPDLGNFHANWIAFPREELLRYAGQFVAWSPDGLRLLASGETEDVVEANLVAIGVHPSQAVIGYVPPPDMVLL